MSELPRPMTNLEALEALTQFDPPKDDEPITGTNRLCGAQWRRDMAAFVAWLRAQGYSHTGYIDHPQWRHYPGPRELANAVETAMKE